MTQSYEGSTHDTTGKATGLDNWGVDEALAELQGLPPEADTSSELSTRYAEWGISAQEADELPSGVDGLVDGSELMLPVEKNDLQQPLPTNPYEAITLALERGEPAPAESQIGSAAKLLTDLEAPEA